MGLTFKNENLGGTEGEECHGDNDSKTELKTFFLKKKKKLGILARTGQRPSGGIPQCQDIILVWSGPAFSIFSQSRVPTCC